MEEFAEKATVKRSFLAARCGIDVMNSAVNEWCNPLRSPTRSAWPSMSNDKLLLEKCVGLLHVTLALFIRNTVEAVELIVVAVKRGKNIPIV